MEDFLNTYGFGNLISKSCKSISYVDYSKTEEFKLKRHLLNFEKYSITDLCNLYIFFLNPYELRKRTKDIALNTFLDFFVKESFYMDRLIENVAIGTMILEKIDDKAAMIKSMNLFHHYKILPFIMMDLVEQTTDLITMPKEIWDEEMCIKIENLDNFLSERLYILNSCYHVNIMEKIINSNNFLWSKTFKDIIMRNYYKTLPKGSIGGESLIKIDIEIGHSGSFHKFNIKFIPPNGVWNILCLFWIYQECEKSPLLRNSKPFYIDKLIPPPIRTSAHSSEKMKYEGGFLWNMDNKSYCIKGGGINLKTWSILSQNRKILQSVEYDGKFDEYGTKCIMFEVDPMTPIEYGFEFIKVLRKIH